MPACRYAPAPVAPAARHTHHSAHQLSARRVCQALQGQAFRHSPRPPSRAHGPRGPRRLVAPGRFSGCLRYAFPFHRTKTGLSRLRLMVLSKAAPGRDHAGIPCIRDRAAPDESDAVLCVRNGAALPEGGKTAALWRGGERMRFGCKPSCYPAAWRLCRASTILKRLFRTWGAVGGGAQCAYFFSSLADCRYRSSSRSTRFLAIWYGSLTGRATVFSCGEPSRRRI